MKPLIGLTPTPEQKEMEHGTFRLHTLNDYYSQAVIAAGGLPVMLPLNNTDIDSLLNRLDAVIITGGGDIDPDQFGQKKHETTDGIDHERDAFELAIVHAASARDMPLLGICRGLQILNVAWGGTLQQDIHNLVHGAQQHKQQDEKIGQEDVFHSVMLSEGDHPLRKMVSTDRLDVNSFHHQCIRDLAEPLRVMARSEDEVIEAVYNPGMTFGMAVQWHPEMQAHKHDDQSAIFRALIEAAISFGSRTSKREVPELV